jgi:fimbrial chaperone protein
MNRFTSPRGFLYVFWLLVIWIPGVVSAGSFSVTPLRVELSKSEPTRIINLQNLEPRPVTVQLQILAWSHRDGTDHFIPTRDVIVNPQIFHLKANSLQIVRAGLIRRADTDEELSYRLFIEEIPEPPTAEFKGAQLALKISLPVFIASEKNAKPNLEFHSMLQSDGNIKMKIVNTGRSHTHIQALDLFSDEKNEQSFARLEKSLYVLPGQERNVVLKIKNHDFYSAEKFFIRATTRNGQIVSYASAVPP